MKIIKATLENVKDLIPLFDGYRVFYKQESDFQSVETFLSERLRKKDSVIFIYYSDGIALGFTQLYPLFSSVSMQPQYLLNDLFVHSDHRNKGIGEALINRAKLLCKEENNKGIELETEAHNPAQHLYQRMDFERETTLRFFWTST